MAAFTDVGVNAEVRGFASFLGKLGTMDRAIQGTGTTASSIGGQFVSLGNSVLGFGAAAAKVAVTGVAVLGAAVAGLGVLSIKAAIDFESAFAGVLKTVNGLEDEFGNLNTAGVALRQGFRDLAKEVPISVNELAAIGEIGGQLGIGKDALLDFTRTVADLGVTTNLTTEQAAFDLARIANIFNVETDDMGENSERLGATIVDLGNNFATTETMITRFGERIAGAGNIAGLTQADVLAIGAAMSAVGVQAEAGGTAVQKVLLAMNDAVNQTTLGFVDNTDKIKKNKDKLLDLNAQLVKLEAQTGLAGTDLQKMFDDFVAAGNAAEDFGRQLGDTRRAQLFKTIRAIDDTNESLEKLQETQGRRITAEGLETFAKTAGVTSKEFQRLFEEDAAGAFQLFVEGLGRAGDDATGILEELGLADQRLIRSFLSLSNAGDLLGETLELSNKAWDENSALTTEAEKRYRTTASQIQLLKNSVKDVAISIGDVLLPILNKWIEQAKPIIEEFGKKLPKAIEKLIDKVKKLISAFKVGGITGLAEALGFSPETIATMQNVAKGIVDVINFVREHWEAFQAALIGIGAVLAIAATVAVITATIALITNPIFLIIAAVAALAAAWQTDFLGIRTALTEFWETTGRPIFNQIVEWLQVNIPIAIAALSDFWKSTLLPALSDVWDFIINSVIPALSDIWTWLSTNIPAAIQTVSDFWQNTLLPAIQAVSTFLTDTLIPTLAIVWDWINNQLATAIQTGSAIWNTYIAAVRAVGDFVGQFIIPILSELGLILLEVGRIISDVLTAILNSILLPALDAVWGFIQEKIIPIFQTVGDKTNQVVLPAFLKWAEIWNDVLMPALESVWDFIKNKLLVIFEELRQFIAEKVGPALVDFKENVVEKLTDAFEGLKKILVKVRDFLNNIRDALNTIQIPPVLLGKSPSPFEKSLRGIADAMQQVSNVGVPAIMGGVPVGATGITNQTNTVQIGPNTISDPMSEARIVNIVRQEMATNFG